MAAPATPGRQVEVNGASLYVEEHGAGVPLVLVHGATRSRRMWDPTLPFLTPYARVITFDNRGHGHSTDPSGGITYRLIANDTAALVEALGLDRPLVGGYSLGGLVALEFGLHHSHLARGLIVGGATTGTEIDVARAQLRTAMYGDQDGIVDFDALERENPALVPLLRAMQPDGDQHW